MSNQHSGGKDQGQQGHQPTSPGDQASALKPGDQAAPGTPGTGENLCRDCGGSGRKSGVTCPSCQGTGTVTTGIGGA